ncbi:beta-mannosidase B [Capronia coronata CBS 617.96]|uniref:Beta-mannosidase B n=1 Tax=Capronia coronata CBS 617.96 TaxID=1182541 RepID=W9Y577_9EURO|nr:beta-mannosidase B [Capronia coronata CBS 617.96]EXJ87683.1 beta-mannosidase B [Capronia coronata CBS 617.96]
MVDTSGHGTVRAPMETIDLSLGWSFQQADQLEDSSWFPVKKVPSTVHQDLIDNNLLEDPFIGFNEIKAEWVGLKSWTYRTKLARPSIPDGSKAILAFDGLDTFAHVRLDGSTILESDNMFLPHRVDVTNALRSNSRADHDLEVTFDSSFLKARELKDQHPEHKFICFNGDPARLAVRKAQYHWGWDWGPVLMCAGIWRPVRLEIYSVRMADLRIDTSIADDQQAATIHMSALIEGVENHNAPIMAKFDVSLEGRVVATHTAEVDLTGQGSAQLQLPNPRLWMPVGYGDQPLYTVRMTVAVDRVELHTETKRIGLRKIELIQEPDSHGKSFYFRVNNVDIFCGGSCWIPTDSFLTNVTPAKYRAWLELLVPANQKMIRVWGGGIYEDDAFYDACDELGILVWQDFMFGCGNYPCFPAMLRSIQAEAVANVRRIRHHPCLAIFAGNNEDYQVAESAQLTYDYEDKNEEHWLESDFPARYIYEALLPKVCAAEAPWVAYHPGSPWGDGRISSDPSVGDLHQWNVWHGTQEKYQIFDSLGGRFNSEFGMEAFPHLATIKSFVEKKEDLFPQSHVLDFHNKADGHERRIATYLVENVRTATQLEAYIHLTQLVQCEALMFGYRGWRKQWGDGRHCGGALVWQLNDCWPVTSWSIVDYYLRRKPAYYAMARVLAPVAVGIRRAHHDWSVTHAREPQTQNWELWVVSSRLTEVTADVEVRFVSVRTGREIKEKIVKKCIRVAANGTTNVVEGVIDNVREEPHVLAARIWINGELVGRDTDWPQPLKYLSFAERKVKVEAIGDELHVSAERPVKCLVFEEREGCHLSDSAIDLVPNDTQVIRIRGLKAGAPALSWTYLGAGEQ